jgi:hypothetical protein
MKIDLKLDQLSSQLTQTAQQAYPESGALKSSIKVEVTGDDIVISFKNYGLFQDAGVQGAFGTKHPSGQGYNKTIFRYKPTKDRFGRPTPVGGNLKEWGARVNIRKFGIPAKPWIAKMLTSLSDQIAKDIEITLPPQIEAEVAKLLGSIK